MTQREKQQEGISFDLEPRPFQPIVQSEKQKFGKRSIDTNTKKEPNSFVLNIINSPYLDPIYMKPPPSKPDRSKTRSHAASRSIDRSSQTQNVNRLNGDEISRYERYRCQRMSASALQFSRYKRKRVPYFLTPVGYSESLLHNNYYPMPFDISLLDPKQKILMHAKKKSYR